MSRRPVRGRTLTTRLALSSDHSTYLYDLIAEKSPIEFLLHQMGSERLQVLAVHVVSSCEVQTGTCNEMLSGPFTSPVLLP